MRIKVILLGLIAAIAIVNCTRFDKPGLLYLKSPTLKVLGVKIIPTNDILPLRGYKYRYYLGELDTVLVVDSPKDLEYRIGEVINLLH